MRVPARLAERDLPQPIRRAMTSTAPGRRQRPHQPSPTTDGFAALCRSGLYTALRARGALVGAGRDRTRPARRVRRRASATCSKSLSSVLALSLDNARWFGRLHTLGAEAERGRIARELHDRIAQSLAYVTFELERLQTLPGDKHDELDNLHDVVRDIMQELRETIYQLRANVSEENEFTAVAADYLARFEERTGIATIWAPDTRRGASRTGSSRSCGASCRRRSPTSSGTPARRRSSSAGTSTTAAPASRSPTTARASTRAASPATTTASSACGSGPTRSAPAFTIVSRPGRGTSVVVELETRTPRHADQCEAIRMSRHQRVEA